METNTCSKLLKSTKPISTQCCISYRNQLFDFQCKSNDWFLYELQHWVLQVNG